MNDWNGFRKQDRVRLVRRPGAGRTGTVSHLPIDTRTVVWVRWDEPRDTDVRASEWGEAVNVKYLARAS